MAGLIRAAFLLVLFAVSSAEEYQNSSGLCVSVCKCDETAGVYTVDCNARSMRNVLAEWPELPKNATRLIGVFSGNEVVRLGPMPPTDVELVVYYDRCNVTDLESGLFENVPSVKHVDLSYNLLEGDDLHSDVFKGPYNNTTYEPIDLEHLNLAHNRIHTLEKNVFEHMPNLKWLNLEGNNMRVLDVHTAQAFLKLDKLEYLNLAGNKLMDIQEDALKPLRSLNVLDLSNNQLTIVPEVIVDVGKTLKKLILDGNHIVVLEDSTFEGMDELVEISARNLRHLHEIKTNTFASTPNLERVDLSGMNGTYVADRAFGDIAKIRELNLSNSHLTRLPIDLVNWTELRSLDIRDNDLYCECYLVNITGRLSEEVVRDKNRPLCFDYNRYQQFDIYELNDDVCFEGGSYSPSSGKYSYHDLKVMRMTILMLSLLLIVSAGVAVWLGYVKYVNDRSTKYYPFASSVIYNPLTTTGNTVLT